MPEQDSKPSADRALNHPATEEWMDFLYGECAEDRCAEMEAHAAGCSACAEKLKEWRSAGLELDQWRLPASKPSVAAMSTRFVPLVKWSVAAAFLVLTGFLAGQYSSDSRTQIAALKSTVADLANLVQRNQSFQTSNTLVVATETADTEAAHLIAAYSADQESQRLADQKAVATVLNALELRLEGLHSEITTVALNTQTGFHQTHQNLVALASLSESSQPGGNSPKSSPQ